MNRFTKKHTFQSEGLLVLFFTICMLIMPSVHVQAQEATWIWYPGDYEIWLSNQVQVRRTERGAPIPPIWRLYSHYVLVNFYKSYDLANEDDLKIEVEGKYRIKLDGKRLGGSPAQLRIPAGKHNISIKVFNQNTVPSIYVKGTQIVSDSTWKVTYDDKQWLNETGQGSGSLGAEWRPADHWNFNDPEVPPALFKLEMKPEPAMKSEKLGDGKLVDFGKETFGYLVFHGLKGTGKAQISYGESKEEAMAPDVCETFDELEVDQPQKKDYTMEDSKAFRFVNMQPDATVSFDSVSMLYEYLPVDYRGRFRCSDNQVNKIWDIAAYTLHLNTREFFLDGIKRDRWIWSGDAYQSYLMNYYLFFDRPTVERTLVALRGKDPVSSHINLIMDYSFYWFLGIYDYYLYTGDKSFIQKYYPRMVSLMDYCLNRRNEDGMMAGLPGDWVYIDWAPMNNNGEVSFEQLLFTKSLETMAICSKLVDDKAAYSKYGKLAADLKAKLIPAFWSDKKHAFVHSRVDGKQSDVVTRYTNMFAVFFDYIDKQKQEDVKEHVLLNDSIQKITTPYMRFYELEALCALGEQDYVRREIKSYWGGMLDQGATSFWEKYDPSEKGVAQYAMYGRPFGKSLCHAWGASPIYLLGKYFLGVKPTAPGYKEFTVEPHLGGLKWIDGSVPTSKGSIDVYCDQNQIKVKSTANGTGTLRFKSHKKPSCKKAEIRLASDGNYEMTVEKDMEYTIRYTNPD